MYHEFCLEAGIGPDDIRSYEDLGKIPLIPNEFFKDCPTGKDFALWLGNLYTGELPQIRIKGSNPNADQVVNAFNAAGMAVFFSSGTGGRHTFMPRDMRSFHMNEYAMAKGVAAMFYPTWNPRMNGYLLLPNPFKTNLFAGRLGTIFYDIMNEVESAVDRKIDTELIRLSMGDGKGIKGRMVKYISKKRSKRTIDDIISWIEKNDQAGEEMAFVGAPFLLYSTIQKLKEQGRTFDLGDRGAVLTGGGWKLHEHKRIPEEEFRNGVQDVLGIRPENVIDLYGMVEGNAWMTQCPEGHYLHIPNSFVHAMVLDDSYRPLGYGKVGRFAFLDGSMYAYPGFIITNDRVSMLERCPVCGRPGPVLEPGVTRVPGKESRGCAEEVRKMISVDMKR
jgi:phenylacetate-coenzyme A ligase PaaK-like adenylate-forming protein